MSSTTSSPILIITINELPSFDESYSHLLSTLKARAMIHEVSTAAEASAKLISLRPTVVLITTPDFADPKKRNYACWNCRVHQHWRYCRLLWLFRLHDSISSVGEALLH